MKKVYLIPNIITTANMFGGFMSMIYSIQGEFTNAAWAIVIAGFCDLLDGRIARMMKTTSQFGVEYDSMSDLVSFGVAPSILFYLWVLSGYGQLGIIAAFAYTACGALRLARFNVVSHSFPYFQGLPSPVAAGTAATFLIFCESKFVQEVNWSIPSALISLILVPALGLLMVSELRFPSSKKFVGLRSLVYGILFFLVLAVRPEVTFFIVSVSYVTSGLIGNLLRKRSA